MTKERDPNNLPLVNPNDHWIYQMPRDPSDWRIHAAVRDASKEHDALLRQMPSAAATLKRHDAKYGITDEDDTTSRIMKWTRYYTRQETPSKVRGRCPSCNSSTLFLGEGGYITCSLLTCTDPSAASNLLTGETRVSDISTDPQDEEPDEPALIPHEWGKIISEQVNAQLDRHETFLQQLMGRLPTKLQPPPRETHGLLVAWRCQMDPEQDWWFTADGREADGAAAAGGEVHALYLHPDRASEDDDDD